MQFSKSTPSQHTPRRAVLRGGAGALAAAMLPIGALTVVAAQPAQALPAGLAPSIEIGAGYLKLKLDAAGTIVGLVDVRTGVDYMAPDRAASLVSLVVDGAQQRPTVVNRSGRGGRILSFRNTAANWTIQVEVVGKAGYTTFEAVAIDAPKDVDVQTLLWGPLATSISETVGTSVGVVRDDDFAIGLRPLTDRTEGAWPQEYQDMGWESEIDHDPDHVSVGSLEEWSAAGVTPWGSVLRAFTFDYTEERHRKVNGYPIPVGPLPGRDGKVAGSKMALFGASPEATPTILSYIAAGEKLPYPRLNGQWQKASQASSQSWLVLGDLQTGNIPAAARFAKAAGMNRIYSLTSSYGPWESSGHYKFDSSLGGSDAGAAAAVDIAEANGVQLGVHTLSDFISTGDEPYNWSWFPRDDYLTPPADDRLVTGGRASLTRPLTAGDTTVYLDSGALLAAGVHHSYLRIGDEFVSYGAAEQVGKEWKLTGVQRARWGSVAVSHAVGDRAARVVANSYGGAIGNHAVLDEISDRLTTAWNNTGITGMSWDGLESASESGWGAYGMAHLVNGTFRRTNAKDRFISETSRMTSNTWDALTRASWGEVGSTSMEQVFKNNKYLQANYLPGMLGWISLKGSDSLLTMEWKLARGAGLNAGAGFQSSVSSLVSGGENTTRLLDAIQQWETARNLGAFTAEQRARFRDLSTNWHLTVVEPGKRWSLQELDADGKPVGNPQAVVAPIPKLDAGPLPAAAKGALYETTVKTNTPATTRYAVTSGALPHGLVLNADTGGIVGTPVTPGTARFTITAYQSSGQPRAQRDYEIDVAK
ncbi:Ig domain-containing protein [Streptomyces sp. NBC_00378]|uniref:Ig domain-containing protein n=1 Tax=unclassified Streptomyces TaxID=2593676 RepID=UPI00225A8BB6|nr:MULTISPECIES: Ig domain-containing protein [unclassified Streptomyces]MCX5107097.1 Ig domain-containing protein [Streptomyces sp. NBC_00378]